MPQTRMRSRKIAIARHCRRDRAYVYPAIRDGWRASALASVIERAGLEMAPMHSTRTAVFAMLVALLLSAPAVLAETAPSDRSKTAAPISAELAKKCRALAIKAHPTERAGSRAGTYAGAAGLFPRLHCQRRQYAGLSHIQFDGLDASLD